MDTPASGSSRTLLDSLFRPHMLAKLFSDRGCVEAMLRFEAALARSEAKAGIIPAAMAERIGACCVADRIDLNLLREDAAFAGNLAIPLLKQLTASVRAKTPEAAGFVHWGATSQDVQDTALVLQIADALAWFDAELERLCAALAQLAATHRSTLMAGRTWMQHAVPVTFGLKLAGCLDALLRQRTRLQRLTDDTRALQFGGASGTLAALGERGLAVAQGLAAELHLLVPDVPWHSHRDRLADVAAWAGMLTGTLGKMARDLSLGMQTELGELAEAAAPGRGGSSTMPQKRNPVGAATALSAAVRVPGLVATMLAAMVQENERGLGGWHAEWETLPEILMLAGGALESMSAMLSGLEVFPDAMQANLEKTCGLLLAEAIAMRLAQHMGKDEAHRLVAEAARKAVAAGSSFEQSLAEDSTVTSYLAPGELHNLLDPARYLGLTDKMIALVLSAYEHRQKEAR